MLLSAHEPSSLSPNQPAQPTGCASQCTYARHKGLQQLTFPEWRQLGALSDHVYVPYPGVRASEEHEHLQNTKGYLDYFSILQQDSVGRGRCHDDHLIAIQTFNARALCRPSWSASKTEALLALVSWMNATVQLLNGRSHMHMHLVPLTYIAQERGLQEGGNEGSGTPQ